MKEAELENKRESEVFRCWEYIYRKRWVNHFHCPMCGSTQSWLTTDGKCKCANTKIEVGQDTFTRCTYSHAVTAETIFYKSVSIDKCFKLIWYLSADSDIDKVTNSILQEKTQISRRALGDMRRRLSPALIALASNQLDMLSGVVEVDVLDIDVQGCGMCLIVAAEVINRKAKRIRGAIIENDSTERINAFLDNSVEKGARIYTNLSDTKKDAIVQNGYDVVRRFWYQYKLHAAGEAIQRISSRIKAALLEDELTSVIDQCCAAFNYRHQKFPYEELLLKAVSLKPEE